MTSLLWQFSYLQVLDYLTTIAFLTMGIQEANPIVRAAMSAGPSPFLGLAAVKVGALALGLYCLKLGKVRLLSRMNLLFAVVVTWNLLALILGAAQNRGVL